MSILQIPLSYGGLGVGGGGAGVGGSGGATGLPIPTIPRPSGVQAIIGGSRFSILTTLDGITFNLITPGGGFGSPKGICWNGSIWCMVNASGLSAISPDGITWTIHAMPHSRPVSGLEWNGSVFCTVAGHNLTDGYSISSPDGINWTETVVPSLLTSGKIAQNGGKFFVWKAGQSVFNPSNIYTFPFSTSTDGVTWAHSSFDFHTPTSYVPGNSGLAYGGANGFFADIESDGSGSPVRVLNPDSSPSFTAGAVTIPVAGTYGAGKYVNITSGGGGEKSPDNSTPYTSIGTILLSPGMIHYSNFSSIKYSTGLGMFIICAAGNFLAPFFYDGGVATNSDPFLLDTNWVQHNTENSPGWTIVGTKG